MNNQILLLFDPLYYLFCFVFLYASRYLSSKGFLYTMKTLDNFFSTKTELGAVSYSICGFANLYTPSFAMKRGVCLECVLLSQTHPSVLRS